MSITCGGDTECQYYNPNDCEASPVNHTADQFCITGRKVELIPPYEPAKKYESVETREKRKAAIVSEVLAIFENSDMMSTLEKKVELNTRYFKPSVPYKC